MTSSARIATNSTAIILLAAGGSRRLGHPKQRVLFRGESLLRHMTQIALGSSASEVVVVLGFQASILRNDLQDLPVAIVENPVWERGMGSSLKAGLAAARAQRADLEAVLFMTVDQPAVTTTLLNALWETCREGGTGEQNFHHTLAACTYGDSVGVPAVFGCRWFGHLEEIGDSEGAKRLLNAHRHKVRQLAFPEGDLDIDTPEDLSRLRAT